MYKGLLTLSTVAALFVISTAMQAGGGQVRVMPRVDRSSLDVHIVLNAWVDSLSAWRGSASDEARLDRSAAPGSARTVVTQWFGQSDDVIRDFPPTVLSIEPENDLWVVRTMFSTDDPESGHVIPLGILRTYFRFTEDGLVETVSPLDQLTATWITETIGQIHFRYPSGMPFNRTRARDADRFMQRTAEYFTVEPPTDLSVYVAPDRDQMCALFGLEYYAFPPSGMAYPDHKAVFAGLGDPFYPHEITHVVIRDLDRDAHPIVSEGVATWLGGSVAWDFSSLVHEYFASHEPEAIPSFIRLFTDASLPQTDQYVLGSVLIDAVHQRHGSAGVRQILAAPTTSGVMLALSRMLGIDPQDRQGTLLPLITETIERYKAQPGR